MIARAAYAAIIATALCGTAAAQVSDGKVRIGVLTDQSGFFASITGKGSVTAARMAIEDFGGKVLGMPIELVDADHQNKADVGASIARQWFDVDGVDMIIDLPNSSVALAVQNLGREKNRIVVTSGAGSADLTGKSCSPTGIHWTWDTYAVATSTGRAIVKQGGDSWFFITADYAFGQAMERDIAQIVRDAGGKIVGSVKHPTNNADFSSFIVQAQASKAKVVALANGGNDTSNAVKQATEFGLVRGGQRIVGLAAFIGDIHAMGLNNAQGMWLTTSFYWDKDDEARAWSKRFFERHNNVAPTMTQAGVHSAITHYLKAIQAAGTDAAPAVMAKMREMPVNDFFTRGGKLREDGRMEKEMYLVEIKSPQESKYPWDYYKILQTIPGDQAFRPLASSECPLIKK